MHWQSDALQTLLFGILVLGAACDQAPEQDFDATSPLAPMQPAPTPEFAGSTSPRAVMIYEDDNDHSILHDTSNLRPPDMDENDYRRLLQETAQEELRLLLPDARLPTQADADQLSMRWFTQGVGFVVQNHSEQTFSISARFSSSTDSACKFSVPWKSVGPTASAMYTASDHLCPADHAEVTINDEYGFFVDSVVVTPSEAEP